jgi:hypothetical protein
LWIRMRFSGAIGTFLVDRYALEFGRHVQALGCSQATRKAFCGSTGHERACGMASVNFKRASSNRGISQYNISNGNNSARILEDLIVVSLPSNYIGQSKTSREI